MAANYDTIGKTYTSTRAADPRITRRLIDLLALPENSSIIDIGAGSGNYRHALTDYGFDVMAVEPSETMRAQARVHKNLTWQDAVAEALPFADDQFDGAVMTLSLHHFTDWRRGIEQALRVTATGPLVIFAFDIEPKSKFWLYDYFPEFAAIDQSWSATLSEIRLFIEQVLQYRFDCFPFPLPKDLIDHFAAAGWARPEIYLEERYRHLLASEYYDPGYLFLRIQK